MVWVFMLFTMKHVILFAMVASLYVPVAVAEKPEAEEKPNAKKKRTGIFELIDNRRKRAFLTQAINNAKQIFCLMVEFDGDFGEFPSDETASGIDGGKEYKGAHSNDYLGQLIVAGYTKAEGIFYVEKGAKKQPDNIIDSKARTLAAGECGFTYVLGQSLNSHSSHPLLCAPMTGDGTKFDPEVFGGKALVLRIDGSVKTYEIDENGEVVLENGKKLFETGIGTVWGVNGFKREMLLFPK